MSSEIQLFDEEKSSDEIGDIPLESVIESYLKYYASGTSHTARAKQLDLKHFINFLTKFYGFSNESKLHVKHWDHSSVQRFVDDSLQKGEAPSTVARRLATIKHMGRTLSDKIAGFVNPAKDVKTPKTTPLKPKALTEEDIKEVREQARLRLSEKDSFIRFRNQTLFEFMIDTGLRADEVRLLKRSQVDDQLEWISNVRTKGRRFRNVYITTEVREILEGYLEERRKTLLRFYESLTPSQDKNLPLFISTYNAVPGEPESFYMGAKTIWRAVNELSAGTQLHPHLLRHSYAIDLLDASNDVRLVAQALGHSDVRITMRYTQRMDEEVAKALEKSRSKKRSHKGELEQEA